MKHPALLIFANAMILIVVFALLAQSLFIVGRVAQARAVVGHVEVQRGGRGGFSPLASAEFVKTGDIVRTASDGSAEFTWAGGTRWKVMPNTLIKIKKATLSRAQKSEQSQLELSSGKVFVRIAKALAPASRFEVETPGALASVRGTIFSVEVHGAQTHVRVWKGEVALSSASGQNALLQPGQAARADDSAVQMRPDAQLSRDFAAQPSIISPALEAGLSALPANQALIAGTTEAGDEISVNGQSARVLSSGAFRLELSRPRDGRFTIVARDRHSATSTWRGSLPFEAPSQAAPRAAAPRAAAPRAAAPRAAAPRAAAPRAAAPRAAAS